MEAERIKAGKGLASPKHAGCLFLLFFMAAQCGCTESGPPAEQRLQAPASSVQRAEKPASPATPTGPGNGKVPAAQPSAAPGHYATDQGWGQLTIEPEKEGASRFSLETVNAGYSCSFSGKLRGTQAAVYDGDTPGMCFLEINGTQNGISIHSATGAEDQCREYCGVNGSFEGDYLRLDAACEPATVQRTRSAFQALYDRKDYAKAEATLAPIYRRCLTTADFVDEGAIRNDYAITQHKLGDDAACLEALASYRGAADQSDDDIIDGMTSEVVDDYLSVIHAARTNIKLCGGMAAH